MSNVTAIARPGAGYTAWVRIAWFSPWPPQSSGIATYSAEVVAALTSRGHGVDVFVDERRVAVLPVPDSPAPPGEWRLQTAHDFVWRAGRGQYDLAVYQIGNSHLHDFVWPYLFRWPGLAVLHETRLHHARGHALLAGGHLSDYRSEFAWNHPHVSPAAAELAVRGFSGSYYYLWPMLRRIAESSRCVATHTEGSVAALQMEFPDRAIDYIALGHGRPEPVTAAERAASRSALGVAPGDMLFGVFGALTAEKRIAQILRAFACLAPRRPFVRLLLAGARDASVDIHELARDLGVHDRVMVADDLTDAEFASAIVAADVSLNLRWPTAIESSGPWLRALAAARPTVTTALEHQAHVPAFDPRTWMPLDPESRRRPVTIAIDLLDEEHSLRLAMDRLATDEDLRASLGIAGRTYWEQHHSPARMMDDYERVLTRAAALAGPDVLPAPFATDPLDHARELLAPFGETPCT
ncbi:MAG: glycosyltransferase family 4 protein [Vicinamibacterales bacterium]